MIFMSMDEQLIHAGEDYEASSGVVRFKPGQSRAEIFVKYIDDTKPEPHEHFFVEVCSVG